MAELTLKLQLSSFVFRKCRENTDTVSLRFSFIQAVKLCVRFTDIGGKVWLDLAVTAVWV